MDRPEFIKPSFREEGKLTKIRKGQELAARPSWEYQIIPEYKNCI